MRFVDTFEKHRKEPGKSLDAYLKERRLALGTAIADRYKVYLDTKYWLLLRDCKLNRSKDPVIARLSEMLHDGVQSAKLICPISADIFLEIFKQTDPLTLRCSVELIDTLSEGISVLSPEERSRMELLCFLRKNMFGKDSCHASDVFVWTKLAYVLGFMSPYNTPIDKEEELILQKAFLDQMWEISLNDIVDTMGYEAIRRMPRMPDISDKLNAGKFVYADENGSFEATFLTEISGILDTLKPDFGEVFAYLYKNSTGMVPTKEETSASDGPRQLANLIYYGFQHNLFSTELPGLRIPAILHAAIRWDTERKYKSTDDHDIRHAETALPYFNAFLTEHSLRHLLTRSDLKLDSIYNCQVISDPRIAVTQIERAISQQ
jgi:hypothetical protein